MTVAVRLDQIEGSGGVKNAQGWVSVTRMALVSGLSETIGQAQLQAAVVAPDMPILTSAHPTLTGLYLHTIEPAAVGGGIVKVRLIYNRKDDQEAAGEAATVTIGTAIEQQNVNTDYVGRVLKVNAANPLAHPYQIGTVSVGMPKTTLHFTRRETTCPADKSRDYVGTTNSGGWKGVEADVRARVWLCTGIVGNTTDGGATYQVDYDFVRSNQKRGPTDDVEAEVTWDAFPYWIDPATGKPDKDAINIDYDEAVNYNIGGHLRAQMYPTRDFNALMLFGTTQTKE